MSQTNQKVGINALERMTRLLTQMNLDLCKSEYESITVEFEVEGRGNIMFHGADEEEEVIFMFLNTNRLLEYLEATPLQRIRMSAAE